MSSLWLNFICRLCYASLCSFVARFLIDHLVFLQLGTKLAASEQRLAEATKQLRKLQVQSEAVLQEKQVMADKLEASQQQTRKSELELARRSEAHQDELQRLSEELKGETER